MFKNLENSSNTFDLLAAFQYAQEGWDEDAARLFTAVHSRRMKDNGHILKQERVCMDGEKAVVQVAQGGKAFLEIFKV